MMREHRGPPRPYGRHKTGDTIMTTATLTAARLSRLAYEASIARAPDAAELARAASNAYLAEQEAARS
jgi:hypothetical protein